MVKRYGMVDMFGMLISFVKVERICILKGLGWLKGLESMTGLGC